MRVNTAILCAFATIGSTEALFGRSRARRGGMLMGSCGPCIGTQPCNPCPPLPCTSSFRNGCSGSMMQAPMMQPAFQAPMMQPVFQAPMIQPMFQAPMMQPMHQAPMIQAPAMMTQPACGAPPCTQVQQPCGQPTCPPKVQVVQEVHSRPKIVEEVVMTPVVHKRTVQENYVVNKVVQIPQQPVCMPVCATPTCVPCPTPGSIDTSGSSTGAVTSASTNGATAALISNVHNIVA